MRKKLPFLIGLFLVINGLYALYSKKLSNELSQDPCAFCNPTVLKTQAFYEDDFVFALYSHKPILQGHCLVIPKRHVERFEELSDTEVVHLSRIVKQIDQSAIEVFDSSSYLLLQKNGKEMGQTVPHVHIHYIACKKEGGHSLFQFMAKMWIANRKKPISQEMQEVVKKMKIAMETTSINERAEHLEHLRAHRLQL